MILKIFLFCSLALHSAQFCFGISDIPFFDDSPICSEKAEERDDVPFYEFDKALFPYDKRMSTVFFPDSSIPLSYLRPFSSSNDQDIQYLSDIGSPDLALNPSIRLKKRSVNDDDENTKVNNDNHGQYVTGLLSHLLRDGRDKDNIKTIHLPSSFTPRLGRKRSREVERPRENDFNAKSISGRSRVIDLKAGNAFTPRLGRSEGENRIPLSAGNAFTPRLGRSDSSNRIRFNAGSAFTPRLGRSEDTNRVHLNVGSAFTPRLGRSENPNMSDGRAFSPRLSRSESDNRIHLNAGSAFTPRLGRSEGNRMFLNAGNSFTPRLGRGDVGNRIHVNAGSAFTPRLG